MAVTNDWWGSLNAEDYIGCMPNPLPKVMKLNKKYGYDTSIHRLERVHPRPRGGSGGQGGGNSDE